MITDKILGSSISIPFETKSGGVLTAPVSAASLVVVNIADESERTTNVTPTFNRGSVSGVHKAVIDTNHAFYVANGVYELRFVDGTLDGVPLADMVIETISFGAATSANTSLSSLTSTASDHTDKINSIKAATDANLTGNAFTRLGAPEGASISADIAATKAAAEAAETAAEGTRDTRDLDPVDHVWNLRRSGDGTWRSTNKLIVHPGDTWRAGWNCDVRAILPQGKAISAQGDPELVTATDDLTLADPAIGHDATTAKVEFDVAADAVTGETHWIKTEVTAQNASGPKVVYGEVYVQAEPE